MRARVLYYFLPISAGVVELVDTGDLKSPGSNTVPVRVRSPAPVFPSSAYRGVEQLAARRAHNPSSYLHFRGSTGNREKLNIAG